MHLQLQKYQLAPINPKENIDDRLLLKNFINYYSS